MPSHQSWKLIEKLTDEEVDEMILETDVDETLSTQQLVGVPVPQIAERIVEVVTHSKGANPGMSRQHVRTTHTK